MKAVLAAFALCGVASAACIPFTEAKKYVQDEVCVTGKVVKWDSHRARGRAS
jgi:hypothetical protein